jgi:hypothetical protein
VKTGRMAFIIRFKGIIQIKGQFTINAEGLERLHGIWFGLVWFGLVHSI